ncbi:MAG: NADH-quinone oxidoreductase subunit L [Bdellovibrionales bacterium]
MDQGSIQLLLLGMPFMGFLINGFLYKKRNLALAGGIGTVAVFLSFISACVLTYKLNISGVPSFEFKLFSWISIETLNIDMAFSFNRLSALMCLIITGVGTLIHIFSIEYMKGDAGPHKYFSYLNFFIFNMLLLVLGENLLITFIGWEGVGLCSYLLIGFWFTDIEKASAGMKAFIVNRIGDAGFLIGIIILYLNFGTLNYEAINELAPSFSNMGWFGVSTAAVMTIFIGVAGKSAQLPLYVWLPDAMAGPTPVSALIHAATMVTAGVYVLFRLNGLLDASPEAMLVISIIGAVTAFVAAFIALTQRDIKKILAYSTVSQLGYMVLAIGVGSYVGAVFHLLTHAFFKGLMFLGAGSVIHGLSGEQDIEKMGGLKSSMPITHGTFVVGWLSIIGAPLFSGFFSKDEILFHTFSNERGSAFLWIVALITAGMTAFYMTRLMAKVFWGQSRVEKDVHPHEGNFLFTAPLCLLAVLSAVAGFFGVPHALSIIIPGHPGHFLSGWLKPFIVGAEHVAGSVSLEWILMITSIFVAAVSSAFAYFLYVKEEEKVKLLASYVQVPFLVTSSKRLMFIDSYYKESIIVPFKEISKALWLFIDVNLIDRFLVSGAKSIISVGKISKTIQSGNLQSYVALFVLTVAVFLMGALFI